jgi:Bacterial membrane protein YfhO
MNIAPPKADTRAVSGSRMKPLALRHALALVWFAVIALLVLAPALSRGSQFGSFDLLKQFGFLRDPGVVAHNVQAGDQSDSIIPWASLAWVQVHHGHLPLWNPYGALGMPLAFNWQSATFSVPSLVGYLFPFTMFFTVQVVVTLVIAGSGVYALGRVLGWGTIACVFGGTVFELSGAMSGWLGWPPTAVLSWAGWLFAAAIYVLKGHTKVRHIAGVAFVVAAIIYAGQPEVLALLGSSLVLFLVVVLTRRPDPEFGSPDGIRRPLLGLALGAIAGGAIGAPLLLPGLQVIAKSQHALGGDPAELVKGNPPLPPHNLLHILFQGYDGLPVVGNHWFGYVGGYSETAAYLGVIPVVLVIVAVGLRRHRPEVLALSAIAVVAAVVAFVPAVDDVLNHLPVARTIILQRAILPLVFALAVLSGIGMDALVRHPLRSETRRWLGAAFGVVLLLVAGVWLFARGNLPSVDARTRRASFVWAAVEIGVGLIVVAALEWTARSRDSSDLSMFPRRASLGRWIAAPLLVCEAAFLVTAGGSVWTASDTPFPTTPSIVAFKHDVGSAIVGYGAPLCFFPPGLGIPVDAQVAYGVQEFAAYDSALPSAYFSSWKALTGQTGGIKAISAFCPVITTVAAAQHYGVGFVLEQAGTPGPKGSSLSAHIGNEDLYRIPDSAAATLTPVGRAGHGSGGSAPTTPVAVTHADPAAWSLVTTSHQASVLRLRLTNLPGWHATIDGKPVPLTPFAGVMLQTTVPPGRHRVVLTYWPAAFTQGLVLAAVAVVGLVAAGVMESMRQRRGTNRSAAPNVTVTGGSTNHDVTDGPG